MKNLIVALAIVLTATAFSQSQKSVYGQCIDSIGVNEDYVLVFLLLSPNEIASKFIEEKDAKEYNESVKRNAQIYKGKYVFMTTDELDKITSESNYKYIFGVNLYLTYGRKLNIRGCGTMLVETGIYYNITKLITGNIAQTVKKEIKGIENCRAGNSSKK